MKTIRLILGCLLVLVAHSSLADDTFLKSDDYKEGDEVIGKHLTDDDYRLMIEEVERNDAEWDWAWVKTAGKLSKPKVLGFDPGAYKTVTLPEVKNFAGLTAKDVPALVSEAFGLAAQDLGWKVADGGDLELAIALVDIKRDSTFVVFANVKPFLELEIRLKDRKTGENLLLVRHQAHGDSVDDVPLLVADQFAKFLK